MIGITDRQAADARFAIASIRRDLDRLEEIFRFGSSADRRVPPAPKPPEPRRRIPRFLSAEDVEECWRLFESGRSRYDVSVALGITFLAANRRYMGWVRAGGRNRNRPATAS